MKGRFTLSDPEMFGVVKTVTDMLYQEGVDYSVMGGLGVQLLLSKLYCSDGKIPINSSPELDVLLRPTGDIDAILDCDIGNVFRMINELASGGVKLRNDPYHARIGPIFFNYVTSPEELKGTGNYFKRAVQEGPEVTVRRGQQLAYVKVEPPDLIVAAKLSRPHPKDIADVTTLLSAYKGCGVQFPDTETKEILRDIAPEGIARLERIVDDISD